MLIFHLMIETSQLKIKKIYQKKDFSSHYVLLKVMYIKKIVLQDFFSFK